MKNIILFGIGHNGKKLLEAYLRYHHSFNIIAVADNFSELTEFAGIPVIKPDCISNFQYDEIWIATVYYREVREELIDRFDIAQSVIHYVEHPMPFLEQQIYAKYKEEIEGRKHCESDELQEVIDYIASNEVKMYCYPFSDEYAKNSYSVFYDEESRLYYGTYIGHKMYLSREYDTPQKAEQYLRYIHMEQDCRSPHRYLSDNFQIEKEDVGIDIGAAEGVFALDVIDKVAHVYLVEADAGWCEALSLTFREWQQKITIIQGIVSDLESDEQITLDKMFEGTPVDFIKMDIEGGEKKALLGAQNLIKKYMPKLAVCTYHHRSDYQDIREWIEAEGYMVKHSNGYVLCQGEWELDHISDVDFRRALIWAEKG